MVSTGIGVGKLLKRPARDFGNDIIDRRLETCGRFAGDIVPDLIEPKADGKFRGDLGDRETGGLARQGATAAHAWVHLDHDHATVVGVHGELDVRTARLHADLAEDGDRGVAHPLVFLVCKRLGGGDGDAIAGVHAHRVEVFDRADDHRVVGIIAHHLHLVFFPADERFLDEDRVNGAQIDSVGGHPVEFFAVVGDPAAGASQGEARPQDAREADLVADCAGLVEGVCQAAAGALEADLVHARLEEVAVLRLADRLAAGSDQLAAIALENAGFKERKADIQAGLAA